MIKKSFIVLIVACLFCFISSPVFASNVANDVGNTLNNIRDGVQNMARDTRKRIRRCKRWYPEI